MIALNRARELRLFPLLDRAEQRATMVRLAASHVPDHAVAAITGLHVDQVRQIVGSRDSAIVESTCAACASQYHQHHYLHKSICGCCNEAQTSPPAWSIGTCPKGIKPRPSVCICILGEPPSD
jgi:hypothetical protein